MSFVRLLDNKEAYLFFPVVVLTCNCLIALAKLQNHVGFSLLQTS